MASTHESVAGFALDLFAAMVETSNLVIRDATCIYKNAFQVSTAKSGEALGYLFYAKSTVAAVQSLQDFGEYTPLRLVEAPTTEEPDRLRCVIALGSKCAGDNGWDFTEGVAREEEAKRLTDWIAQYEPRTWGQNNARTTAVASAPASTRMSDRLEAIQPVADEAPAS